MWSKTPVYVAGFDRGVRPIGAWSTSTTLSRNFMPSTWRCRPGSALARCRCWASDRSKMSFTSVDLPDPDTPVTAIRHPSGNETSMSLRLCSRAPRTVTTSPSPGRRRAGTGIDRLPDRYWPVIDALFVKMPPRPVTGPGVHDVAAVLPRARTDVDDVVGGADRLLVVLDDDDGVAQVAQPLQRGDEALVVALVQADGRLVQHVEDADEAAPDLAGQADALRLAARQRPGRAGQRQVVEPDVEEELHPLAHFLEHPVGDQVLAVRQLQRRHGVDRRRDREAAQLVDVPPVHRHGQRLGLEPRPVALRAVDLAHVLLDLLARPVGLRLAVAPLQPRDDALEVRVVAARAVEAVLVRHPHGPGARAVEDELLVLRLELLPRRVDREAAGLGHPLLEPGEVLAPRPAHGASAPSASDSESSGTTSSGSTS